MQLLEHPLYQRDLEEICSANLPWEKLKSKTVLITGASGTIGTLLVDAFMCKNKLDGLNITVLAVGRSEEKGRARFVSYWDEPTFHFLCHDVNKPWAESIAPDFIVHAASNTHPSQYSGDPVGTITSNVFGMYHLLELAKRCKSERIMLLSSVEIYGQNKYGLKAFSEEDMGYIDCNTMRAGYPESKRVAESLCQAYIKSENLDAVIVRLCRIYGPTMLESDSKALAQFIKNVLRGEDIVLKSEGTQFFSYCYVADAVTSVLTVLLCGKSGEAYNVADNQSDISLKDLAELIAATNGKQVVFELPDAIESQGFSVADRAILNSAKLVDLSWSAKTSIREGIPKTVEILKAVKKW